MPLPTNIAGSYPDRGPGDTAHQEHHDVIHAAVNEVTEGRLSESGLNAAYVGKASGLATPETLLPVASPTANLTFTAAPAGVADHLPMSVGIDGRIYGRVGGGRWAGRFNTAGDAEDIVFNFGTLPEHSASGAVQFVTRTEAGYIAVVTTEATSIIWHSTDFSAWTNVQTINFAMQYQLGMPPPQKGRDGKTVLFVGSWTGGGTIKPMYASFDGGLSWTLIKETIVTDAGVNAHWHTAAYHAATDTVWLSAGDGPNNGLFVSRDRGVTWVEVPLPATSEVYTADGNNQQPTVIVPFGERLSFGPDRGPFNPGIWAVNPDSGKTTVQFAVDNTVTSADHQYPLNPFGQRGNEAYVAFPASTSKPAGNNDQTYIAATGDGGRSWHLVGTFEWGAWNGLQATYGIAGPDKDGWLYMQSNSGATLLRAQVPDWTWSTPTA